jgi:hypothetical protein
MFYGFARVRLPTRRAGLAGGVSRCYPCLGSESWEVRVVGSAKAFGPIFLFGLRKRYHAKGVCDMTPGPDRIVSCPRCDGVGRHLTLFSGNTFGARVWTDGKMIAPMLPRPPVVVRCRHCGDCYWLADAKEVGSAPREGMGGEGDRKWAEAAPVEEPNEAEYFRALEAGLARDPEQEKALRTLAWWRRNDAFRELPANGVAGGAHDDGPWRKSLRVLMTIWGEEDPDDAIMMAEALREPGEFDTAKQVLGRINSEDSTKIVQQIGSLCDRGDSTVRLLRFVD